MSCPDHIRHFLDDDAKIREKEIGKQKKCLQLLDVQ